MCYAPYLNTSIALTLTIQFSLVLLLQIVDLPLVIDLSALYVAI
jgi:hypothetical protein